MPRRRLLIVSVVGALVFGSAGLAAAGGRHGGSGESRADRPAPMYPWDDRESKHRRSRLGSAETASPETSAPGVPEESAKKPSSDLDAGGSDSSRTSAPAKGSWWRPDPDTTWQWQLTGKLDLSVDAQMYDVDLFDVSASDVAAIHAKGAKAVCYMETGAWEDYRPDASDYPSSVLGKTVEGYSHERYVDIRQLDVLRPILDARLDLCAQKGFDGVEPDIDASYIDVGESGIGFPVSYADQVAFNQMVAADAHARGLAIGLKNGVDSDRGAHFVKDMEPSVDYAVNEECVAYEECDMLAVFPDNGKPVFHAEYLGGYRLASTADYDMALGSFCPVTRPLGFSSILKDSSESLSAWRETCS